MREYDNVSSFFRLIEVAKGVFAAIARPGSGAMGNAGFIDLGDKTIVFDTFLNISAAGDLREAAEQHTFRKVTYVVNSHHHYDHVMGNQIFADVPVISTKETAIKMRKDMDFSDPKGFQQDLQESINQLEQKIAEQSDPSIKKSLTNQMSDLIMFHPTVPQITPTFPAITFKNSLEIHGLDGMAELHSFGGGHSVDDTFLYLPDRKIAFMGDLVSNNTHPWVGHGNLANWKRILEKVSHFDIEMVVTGHGMPRTMENVHLTYRYLNDLENLSNEPDQQKAPSRLFEIPDLYKEWESAHTYRSNILALHPSLVNDAE